MKLLWYWPYPHPGVSPVVAAVVRSHDDVLVQALAPQLDEPPDDGGLPYAVRHELPEPTDGGSFGRLVRRLRQRQRRVRRFDPDVVHLEQIEYRADWLLARRLRTIGRAPGRGPRRLSATVRSVRPHVRPIPRVVESMLLRRLYRSFDILVVGHEMLRQQLIDELHVRADVVHVISPVIARAPATHRAHAAVNDDIVFLGPFRESSGVSVLLEAIGRLPVYGRRRFVFAGGGDAHLEARVRGLAASRPDVHAELNRVPPEQVDALLRRARIVLLPYRSDAVPADRLLDAYRHDVPVVATALGTTGEMVRVDRTGWIVPPDDPAALARAIDQARRDDLAVARFSGAIEAALDRYDARAIGAELRRVLSAPRLV